MTNGFDRFVSQGLRDAGRRVPVLAEPGPHDERAARRVLESSAVVGWLDRLVTWANRTVESSVATAVARRAWHAFQPTDRQWLCGVALIIAPLVHVGLTMWQERPAGWLWLIVPAFGCASGVVMTMQAEARRRKTG